MTAGLIGGASILSVLQTQDAVRRIVFGLIILGIPLGRLGRKR